MSHRIVNIKIKELVKLDYIVPCTKNSKCYKRLLLNIFVLPPGTSLWCMKLYNRSAMKIFALELIREDFSEYIQIRERERAQLNVHWLNKKYIS